MRGAKLAVLSMWALTSFRSSSLRRASKVVVPVPARRRLLDLWLTTRQLLRPLGILGYAVLIGVPFCPLFHIGGGVLGHDAASTSYLQTMWQVVGAALGLSVAMIGFVFEAFINAGKRSLGGSLREFARTTRLQWALSFGVAALVVDGLVLLGLGHEAPRGWAAFCAIVTSGATLGLVLPFVFWQTLRSLEFDYLVGLRRKRIEEIVGNAMRRQLRGQAGDSVVMAGRLPGIGRGLWTSSGQVGLTFPQKRVLRDVKLGPLQGLVAFLANTNDAKIELVVALDQEVSPGNPVLAIPATTSRAFRLATRMTLRTRRFMIGENHESVLTSELTKLHEAAKGAIRERRKGDWESIAEIYRTALLAMPKAAATLKIPFAGDIASPGLFGLGPLDRIQRFLYDEITTAMETGDQELALDVAHFPVRIAMDALDLDAPALVRAMLSLYPTLYWAAFQGP
jgi:hypothetical protein